METAYEKKDKKLVYEVSVIRPLVIFLMVVIHTLAIYNGGWKVPEGIGEVKIYRWISYLIIGFRIQTIAFVAGYIIAYQSIDLKRSISFLPFVWKKFKRLIIPCWFFGLIYYFLFYFDAEDFSFVDFIVKISNGCGHLWFLPMLFWGFIALWLIDKYRPNLWVTLFVLFLLSILPPPIPHYLGLGSMSHYLFYIVGGYFMWTRRNWLIANSNALINVVLYGGGYLITLIVYYTLKDRINLDVDFVRKGLPIVSINLIHSIAKVLGILMLFTITLKYTSKVGFKPKSWIIESSKICYGVYVFHQFILKALYYNSPLPDILGTYWLPIISLLITLFMSVLLTKLTLKTKFGRFLIG